MRITLFILLLLTSTTMAQLRVWVEPGSHTCRAGNQFRTVAQADGGTPPYRFEWFIFNERTGTVNQAKIWTLRSPGVFDVRVVAMDATGRTGEGHCRVEVLPYGLAVRPTSSPRGNPGDRINFMLEPHNMSPPFHYEIFIDDKPVGKPLDAGESQSIWASSKDAGLHLLSVRITDACGMMAWGKTRYWVGPGGPSDQELAGSPQWETGTNQPPPDTIQTRPPGTAPNYPPEQIDTDFEF